MEEFLRNNPNLLNNNINNNITKNKSLQKQLSFNSGQIGPQPFMVARFGRSANAQTEYHKGGQNLPLWSRGFCSYECKSTTYFFAVT